MKPGKASAAFFVLAVVFRIFYIFLYPPSGTDHQMIHTAVDNLLSGNGLSFPIANLQDISITDYQPMKEWPPLAAYLLSVLQAVTGSGSAADLILMISGMLLLLTVLYSLMRVLRLNENVRIILWIIIAANPEPFRGLGITDLFGALFMLWSVLLCIRFIQQPMLQTSQVLMASVFFFLPAAFRYQYYPLIFLFPLLLMAVGKWQKQYQLYQKGILSLSIVFLLLSIQVAMLYQQNGTGAYISEEQAGFYPANLQWIYPFLFKGILNLSYIENNLAVTGRQTMVVYYLFLFVISGFVLFRLYSYLLTKAKNYQWDAEMEKSTLIISRLFLLIVSSAVLLLLVLLSLRYSPIIKRSGVFTYTHEGRYFMVCSLLLLLLLASVAQEKASSFFVSFQSPKKLALASIMVFNLLLFGKFLMNSASDRLVDKNKTRNKEGIRVVETEITRLQQQYQLPVVAVGADKDMVYQFIQKNYSIVRSIQQLNTSGVKASHPVQLVIITQQILKPEEAELIRQNGAAEIFSNNYCRMYHVIVSQGKTLAAL